MRTLVSLLLLSTLLAGCETPRVAPAYGQAADASAALRSLQVTGVGIGRFEGPSTLGNCRGLKPLALPDGMSPTQYVQSAFETELKAAGAWAGSDPRVKLTGNIETLAFSSTKLITMGEWTIALSLRSSNGHALRIQESLDFDSGFEAKEACQNTANAFAQLVQNLVGKSIRDPAFAELLK